MEKNETNYTENILIFIMLITGIITGISFYFDHFLNEPSKHLWLLVVVLSTTFIGAATSIISLWRKKSLTFYREKYEAEIEKAWLRDIISKSLNEIYVFDPQKLRFKFVNAGGLRNTGYCMEELSGMTPPELKPEFTETTFRDMIRPLIDKEKEVHTFTTTHLRKNGSTYPVEVKLQLIETSNQKNFLAIINDITERKLIEDKLKISEERFRNVFEHSAAGKSMTGMDGKLKVNKAFCQILGYNEDDISNRDWREISHPDDIEFTSKMVNSIMAGEKEVARWQKRYLHKNGSTVWTDLSTILQRDKIGNPLYFITTIIDITEQKRVEKALQDSEIFARSVVDSLSANIAILDENGIIIEVNKAWRDFAKANNSNAANAFKGENYITICEKAEGLDSKEALDAAAGIRAVMDGKLKEFSMEYPCHSPEEKRWFNLCVTKMTGSGNTHVVVSHENITKRKNAEISLESQYALQNAMMNSPENVIIFSIDKDYRYTSFNKKHGEEMKKVWGTDIALGMSLLDAMTAPGLKESAKKSIDRVLGGEVFTEIQHQPEVDIYYEFNWNPVYLNREVVGVTNFIHDITDRKRAEIRISEVNSKLEDRVSERTAELEVINSELEAFTFSVSHDLRAPLRTIESFSEFLMEDYFNELDEKGKRFLKTIQDNITKMNKLITDLLSLSMVVKTEINFSNIEMKTLAKSIYHEAASPEIQENFTFSINSIRNAFGDSGLIRQIWFNLISNAIKYSLKSDIKKIEIGGYDDKGSYVYFIKDSGAGFNPEYINKLFGVFQRLHKTSDFEGNGVGLAIVQRIIRRHGGRVWAEGKPGEGATFYFSLPEKINDR